MPLTGPLLLASVDVMIFRCFFGMLGLLVGPLALAQLVSGPMVGYVDHREAVVWVQTERPALVELAYWPEDDPSQRRLAPVVGSSYASSLTAQLSLGPLDAGVAYRYEVRVDGSENLAPEAAAFTTPPDFREKFPPPDVSLAFVGGHYVNDRLYDPLNRIPGAGYEIFEAIDDLDPFSVIWLGNTVHLREVDWGSPAGVAERYRRGRAVPELAGLLASTAHYATWGRHDSGPPNAIASDPSRAWTREQFRQFWPRPGRGVGGPASADDLVTRLRVSDVEVFLLDDRSHRDLSVPNPLERVIYGKRQLDWLLAELKSSPATFKVVCSASSILNPAEGPGNATQAPREREQFLESLRERRIGGVIFITGGKPFGELTRLVRSSAHDLHEITVGPVTARPVDRNREINYLREPGTSSRERHFVFVRFHGPETERVLTISVRNTNGEEIWNRPLTAEELNWGS